MRENSILNSKFRKYIKPYINYADKVDIKKCSECGGLCCKQMACHISPKQLVDYSEKSIIDFIQETKVISIDWWEPDEEHKERGFFLRVRNKNAPIIDPSFYGECSLLSSKGCMLLNELRPFGGLFLIPSKDDNKCIPKYTKEKCANEWREEPYRSVIINVFDYFSQIEDTSALEFEQLFSFLSYLNKKIQE